MSATRAAVSLPAAFTPSRISCHGAVIRFNDRQQGIKEQLAVTRGRAFNKIPAFVKLSVGEVPDLERQPRGQRCQYIAPFDGGLERGELITSARRAYLLQYPSPDLSVLVVGIDIGVDRGGDPVLKHARQPLGSFTSPASASAS